MSQFFGGATVLLLGALGWLTLEFVGRPIRKFFDLRREIFKQLSFLANVPAAPLYLPGDDPLRPEPPSLGPLKAAQRTFRDLGSQCLSVGKAEWPASMILRLLKYDATAAGSALIGLSNALPEYGAERANHRRAIHAALRFTE